MSAGRRRKPGVSESLRRLDQEADRRQGVADLRARIESEASLSDLVAAFRSASAERDAAIDRWAAALELLHAVLVKEAPGLCRCRACGGPDSDFALVRELVPREGP